MNRKKIITRIGILVIAIIAISTAVILAAPNINLSSSQNGNTVDLSWKNNDTTSTYNYRVLRSVNGGAFNGLSATNTEKIKVLNIHPTAGENIVFTSSNDGKTYTLPKSASLKMWMESANSLDANGFGRGLINVDTVSLANFNANPSAYLKQTGGKYNYDVIMFGTWDSNNSEDINATSLNVVKQYLNAGGGAIFGHDTVNQSASLFGQLQPYINLTATANNTQEAGAGTCNVVITKNGTFTTYPWNIGTQGTVLTVPQTHAWHANAAGDIWLRFQGWEYNGSNFYLTTYNNCAAIQTGHSSGAATEDEQKILANLIFYLADVKATTTDTDTGFVDINAPNNPVEGTNTLNGVNGTITYSATDNGTTYKYYVEATEKISQTKTSSNTVTEVRLTGVAGYSYVIDSNATTEPDNTSDTTSTSINYTLGNGPKTYLHIKTIDGAGNVSGTTHILLHDNIAPELTLTQNITKWTNQDVTITATGTDIDGTVVTVKKPDGTVANGTSTTYTIGTNGIYEFEVTDNSGATTKKSIEITNIDKVNPEGTATITQPTASVREAIINFSATDDASGVAKIVKPDGTEVTEDNTTYSVTTPGTYTFKVVDNAGNEKTVDIDVVIVSDGLEVKYIDQVTGEEVATKDTITGNVNDDYTTTAKTINGYELVLTPNNANGKLTMDKITVTYEYRKNSNVTVEYVDENSGEKIIPDIVTKYKEGDAYTTEEKTFTGYQLTDKTANTSGTVVREDITVTYKYKKISAGVDIKYIDQVTGKEIATIEHFDGLENDNYTTTPKEIAGYELVLTPANANGKMTVGKITVTYEYRKNSNVTVKYIDENYGTEIIPDIVTKYKEGDAYTTEEKSFDGYQLTDKTTNTSGTVVREDIIVTYKYKKISAGVDVRYIDQVTGEEVAVTEHFDGLELDDYTTTFKTVNGYELVLTPDNANGKMAVGKIIVTYEYRKNSNVIVEYVDENSGEKIIPDVVTKYKEGDSYTTEEKTFTGYQLTDKTTNTSGTVVREDITVTYKYKKISAGVDVKYIDQVTKEEVATSEHFDGLENDDYTTSEKMVDGYTLVLVPDNATGKMTVGKTTVTYEYRKNSNVIVEYIDENYNTNIIANVVTKYKEGDAYTTEEKSFDGYQLTGKTNNTSGTVVREDITVAYRYKKISAGVDTKFIDQVTGQEIATAEHQDGLELDDYTTEAKVIDGYELVKVPTNANGKMTVEKTIVTYEYRKNSNVIVEYIDENYNTNIIPNVVTKYKEGDVYTTEEKVFPGYQLTGKTTNTSGTVGNADITVTYKYKKISAGVEIRYIDQVTGDIIADTIVKTGLEKAPYTSAAKTVEGYELVLTPANANGEMVVEKTVVTYEYRKNSYVTVKYIDENNGQTLFGPVNTKYKEGDIYTTVQEDISGYTFTRVDGEKTAEVGRENIVVTYYYKKNTSVTVRYVDMLDKNKEIVESVVIPGLENDDYETEQKDIEGYIFVETSGLVNGKMKSEPTEVIYKYKKASKLITEHIDENSGEKIVADVETIYKEGDTYEALAQSIPGYVLVREPDEKTGVMGRENVTKTFYYKKLSGGLVVKYVDRLSGDLLDQEIYEGNEADKIILDEKVFLGYVLDGRPEFDEVILGAQAQEVTFYYRKSIVIDMIGIDQETGEEIYKTQTSGLEGDTYTTIARIVDGYEVVRIPDNANGIFTREDTKIIYEYRKTAGKITVKYIDKETNEELESYVISGKEGENYQTERKSFKDYDFVEVVGEEVGVLDKTSKEVVYYYVKKIGKLVVRYIDTEGNELLREETVAKVGEPYKVEEKEIKGYEVIQRPENLEGKYEEGITEVIFIVKKIVNGKVVVKYVDKETGKELDRYVIDGREGDSYQTEKKEFENYKFIEVKGAEAGVISKEEKEVVYYYERKTGNVVVIYEDEDGKELLKEELSGKVGDDYKVTIKDITGYEIVEVPENLSGKYIEGTIELVVKLKKKDVEKGTIIVKYIDKETDKILDSYVINDTIGNNYTTEKKEFKDYKFIEVIGNESGVISKEEKEVIYYYERKTGNVVVIYEDESGKELKREELSGKVGDDYKVTVKDIIGYETVEVPENLSGKYVEGTIELVVKLKKKDIRKGTILITFTDENGQIIKEDYMEEDEVGKPFYIELPEIEGYEIIGDKIIEAKFENGLLVFNAKYKKIEEKVDELPETGDINISLYIGLFIISSYIIKRKLQIKK